MGTSGGNGKGHGLSVRKVEPPAMVVSQMAELEKAIGGRQALVAALSHAPRSKDLDLVLGLVGDPAHDGESLAYICSLGGIPVGELLSAYRAGEIARAQVLATQKVGAALAAVVEETMTLAGPHTALCDACEGTGTITPEPSKKNPNPSPETCRACKGKGERFYAGDLEHKRLALEMGQMAGLKGPGVNIAVTQNNANFAGSAAGGALERLQTATDQILYGEGSQVPIDGEVSEVSEVPPPPSTNAHVDDDWRGEAAHD